MRLTILGGGGFRVPLVYRALSRGPHAGLITELTLHDTDPDRLQAIANVLAAMDATTPETDRPDVTATTDLDEALTGADVVFAAVRTGGTEGRIKDERVALDQGLIGQETVGAGGISYALRSIPEMLHIARRLHELNPQAWLINFTNPAGIVTEALQQVLGNRVIGICDSPIGLVRRATRAAGIPASNSLHGVDYVGLNHLGWLRELEHDGVDQLPALLSNERKLSTFEEGRVFGPRLLRVLGSLPNEYLFYYYFRSEATRALTGASQTRGESIAAQQQELYEQLARAGKDSSPNAFQLWDAARRSREEGYLAEARPADEQRDESDLAGGGYEEVALAAMNAVLTDTRTQLILNVRNGSTIAGLPPSAVIEVPSTVDASGASPLPVGPLTLHQRGLMTQAKGVEEAVIRAVTAGDRDSALHAFALHPLVDSANQAEKLLSGYEQEFPQLSGLWHN
ncbi:6-phospho-beta-glucosidase [Arthrobacter pigmenti]